MPERSEGLSILLEKVPRDELERELESLLARQHRLSTLDALSQTLLEPRIVLPRLDMLGDGRSDHLDDRNVVHIGNRLKLVRLFLGEPDRHGFGWLHVLIVPPRRAGCQQPSNRDTMVADHS